MPHSRYISTGAVFRRVPFLLLEVDEGHAVLDLKKPSCMHLFNCLSSTLLGLCLHSLDTRFPTVFILSPILFDAMKIPLVQSMLKIFLDQN